MSQKKSQNEPKKRAKKSQSKRANDQVKKSKIPSHFNLVSSSFVVIISILTSFYPLFIVILSTKNLLAENAHWKSVSGKRSRKICERWKLTKSVSGDIPLQIVLHDVLISTRRMGLKTFLLPQILLIWSQQIQ